MKWAEGGKPGLLTLVETIARVLSLIAVPVVLAVVGWQIQQKIALQSNSKDYVQVAVSILAQKTEVDPAMRDWAAKLLDTYSPVKFDKKVVSQLKDGSITLPPNRIQQVIQYKLVWYNHLDGKFWEVIRTALDKKEVRNDEFKTWCIPFDENQYLVFQKRLVASDERFTQGVNWWSKPPYNLPSLNLEWLKIMDDERWYVYEVESK